MTEQEYFQERAIAMARKQATHFLQDPGLPPEKGLPHAVNLVRDCVYHLHQPALAIGFVLGFHPMVERWSTWSAWTPVLDLALSLDRHHLNVESEIRLLNCRSQAARELRDYDTALAMATHALQLAEVHDDPALIAASLNKIGRVHDEREDLSAAWAAYEQAYILGQEHLPLLELGHISLNLGNIAARQRRFDEAERRYARAREYYLAANDVVHVAKLECNVVDLHLRTGRLEVIPPTIWEALESLRATGARHVYALAYNDLGYLHFKLGDYVAAQRAFETSIAEAEAIGALIVKTRALGNLGELYVTTREWAAAEAVLAETRELAILCEKPCMAAVADVDRGRMLADQGKYAEARLVCEAAHKVLMTHGDLFNADQARRLLDELAGKLA